MENNLTKEQRVLNLGKYAKKGVTPWNKNKNSLLYCLGCGKRLKDYRSIRCKSCAAKIRAKGRIFSEEHKRKIAEKSIFQKGHSYGNRFKKGYKPWNKGIRFKIKEDGRKNKPKGEENPYWKDEKVGYTGIHMWIRKILGTSKVCQMCGLNDKNKMYHWANISGKYKRNLRDWVRLCVPCHSKFDRTKALLKNYE